MSDVPRARELLQDILKECSGADDDDDRIWIASLAAEALACLYREAPVYPYTRVRCRRMTKELAAAIREYKRLHLDLSHKIISQKFNVSIGRVSEALHYKS